MTNIIRPRMAAFESFRYQAVIEPWPFAGLNDPLRRMATQAGRFKRGTMESRHW